MLKVGQSPQLQAALLGLRQAKREIRSDINSEARRVLKPEWQAGLVAEASTLLQRRALVPSARISFGRNNVSVVAAASNRPLSGGLVPSREYAGPEWGSNRHPQFPARRKTGYVAGPAAAKLISRAIAVWVNTIVDKFREHWEVKR